MSDTPMTNVDKRGCTCPAGEIPEPCEQKYALTECRIAKLERDLAAANERAERAEAERDALKGDLLLLTNSKSGHGFYDLWESKQGQIKMLKAERDALRAELAVSKLHGIAKANMEALKADAERYRVLRQRHDANSWSFMVCKIDRTPLGAESSVQFWGEDLDAAIDAEIARKP